MPTAPPPTATTPIIRPDAVPLAELIARRERILRELSRPGSAALVFAGETPAHHPHRPRPDLHFLYLTGIETEPGAAVLFDPSNPNPRRRTVLFLRPLNPEADRWEGYRDGLGLGLRAVTGFDAVMRTTMLPGMLAAAARRTKRLACLHPFSPHTADVGPDLAVFKKVAERIPGTAIEDRTMLLPSMRAVKSPAEVGLMKRAAAATAAGYTAALRALRPGVGETDIQRAMERAYLDAGAEGHAYSPIVGSGLNATVLHYERNSGPCRAGELILIDSGAQFAGYACDVTRTFPVSGKFTPEQRSLYDLVLKAQLAAIRAAKPGRLMWQVDKAARDVIEAEGPEHADAFPHGTGHQLGLHVHDADPETELEPGMVITIEPGVYFPEQNLGVRIEDDILITRAGNTNLTAAIPKTVEQIEKAMSRRA